MVHKQLTEKRITSVIATANNGFELAHRAKAYTFRGRCFNKRTRKTVDVASLRGTMYMQVRH